MSERNLIYFFGQGEADAGSELKHLVGGKGASLADMTRARLNVPPGFTISAECCDLYYRSNRRWPAELGEQVRNNLTRLEKLTGRRFGRGADPLLVAVRSGAAQSMPGMMDTVLNVGLNPDCVRAMGGRTGNPRGAWEAYRHFLVMFSHTVGGVEETVFSTLAGRMLQELGRRSEVELDVTHIETLCQRFASAYRHHTGRDLPTDPWDMLCQAINAVFDSWNSERAILYRKHHHIEGLLGTAVNVQMMCPSEVSGVMFTANPVNPALKEILIESSFGLGEAVVLGKVTPDRFVLDKSSLQIREKVISDKHRIVATLAQDGRGQAGRSDSASLNDAQVEELARLGLRVEDYFKMPCDIEWALSQGQFYLLQARGIKGAALASHGLPSVGLGLEAVRGEEIAALRAMARPEGTVWSRYNLSEILPTPTPMTWAIVRRFMSGKGGFGLMYRDLGFDPDPALDDDGIFDLVCGRPYCNLSREPRMHYRALPFEHPFATLKANPNKALYPQAVLNPARGGWRFWLLLPFVFWKLARSGSKLRRMSQTFAARFQKEIIPPFVRETAEARQQDLGQLDTPALLQFLETWIQRTLFEFARDSLKPTALAAISLGNLERALAPRFATPGQDAASGLQRAQAGLRELAMGARPDAETDLPGAVRDLAAGRLDRAAFLECFGHRGSQEMELSQPRWAEEPTAVDAMLRPSPAGENDTPRATPSWQETWQRLAAEAKLSPFQRAGLETEVQTLLTYLGLRESAKHYLMQGYALIRRALVELDRRHQLDGGIFFLTPGELPELAQKPRADVLALIGQRRQRRKLALSLPVPQVLFSDDLEAIGREVEHAGVEVLQGVPLSAGVAEGLALVLLEPTLVDRPAEPYILVCPSTDPAWVPLFVGARGLVMETGGVLSHGAIVAREFGLPAVAGLPDVQRRLRTGQRLRVDGGTGSVKVLG